MVTRNKENSLTGFGWLGVLPQLGVVNTSLVGFGVCGGDVWV